MFRVCRKLPRITKNYVLDLELKFVIEENHIKTVPLYTYTHMRIYTYVYIHIYGKRERKKRNKIILSSLSIVLASCILLIQRDTEKQSYENGYSFMTNHQIFFFHDKCQENLYLWNCYTLFSRTWPITSLIGYPVFMTAKIKHKFASQHYKVCADPTASVSIF